ncbi:hypothetical protein VTK56DRAFT_1794 [Thermocarpiscus australiensis]
MDNKRKAGSSAGAGAADGNDRASKRRKMPGPPSEYNLLKGESAESTTAYGLQFLETIRRTKDKSGRLVATYFEDLLPRDANQEYYERIRMPVSLKIIEQKLHNREFKNMSELESYFKRMVTNAKEFYPKNSEIFEDAERVRKAISNYMTKTNPAYKKISGYSCQAASVPDDSTMEQDEGSERAAEGENGDAEGEDDAQGEDDDSDGADDEGNGEEGDTEKKIVLKRRGSRRSSRGARPKPDHEYEGVSYEGLTFQQAQEKIVEELIRKPDKERPEYPYFLDFINLPSRSYRDYFSVITNPLSLKGLQKLVKGIRGRQPATGVSEFKNWAAFEEKASLLWTNAHFYNEEGSEIYQLATELKECFYKELNEAKAVVQEPPQPKIRLKMTPGQETPVAGSKKITIHVGGSRGSTAASPAPQTGQSTDPAGPDVATNSNPGVLTPGANTTGASFQVDKARAASTPGPSPGPSAAGAMPGVGTQQPPTALPRPNGNAPSSGNVPNGMPIPGQNNHHAPSVPQLQNGHTAVAPSAAQQHLWDKKYRAPGRGLADALLPSVLIRTHPSIATELRYRYEIPAHAKEAQQTLVLRIPPHSHRLQLIPRLAPFESQGRAYRLDVTLNGQLLRRATPLPVPDDPLPVGAIVYDLALNHGTTSIIVISVVAALPKGQMLVDGAVGEVETMTIHATLNRFYG